MSKAWHGGTTRAWRRTRAAVLARDNYQCRAHTDGWCDLAPTRTPHTCTGHATQAHHTKGRAVSGDTPADLVASCAPCNRHIGDPARTSPPPRKISKW